MTVRTEGWQPDPATAGQERWFDGERWTNLTRPVAAAASPLTQIPVRRLEMHGSGSVVAPPAPSPAAPAPAPAPAGYTQIRPIGDVVHGSPANPKSKGTGLLAMFLVILLVAGGVGYVVTKRPSGPSYPKIWDERVADLAYFVEAHRGARFKRPIHVDFLPIDQFKKTVNVSEEMTAEDREELEHWAGALRAIGMMSGPIDLEKMINEGNEEGIVGYYDPDTKRITIRGTTLTASVKMTIVHELTHALQDQLYDLRRLRAGAPSDLAVVSLIEGDAEQVESAFEETLTPEEKADLEKAGGLAKEPDLAEISSNVPMHQVIFPYILGPAFWEVLFKLGGQTAYDEAYSRPPQSEAEIINPFRWLARVELDLPAPPPLLPGHKDLKFDDDADDFGQLMLFEMLAARIGFIPAWKTLKGWRGDRTAWSTDPSGKTCVAVNVRFDTEASATAFPQAALPWADMVKGSVIVTGKDALIRTCDPGADAPAWPPAVEEGHAFMLLMTRAGLMLGMLGDDEWSPRKADCLADVMVESIGTPRMLQILKDENAPGISKAELGAIVKAGAHCAAA